MKAKGPQDKEKYERPTVRRVQLVPSELAVAGCKVSAATAGPLSGCQQFPPFEVCRDAGS